MQNIHSSKTILLSMNFLFKMINLRCSFSLILVIILLLGGWTSTTSVVRGNPIPVDYYYESSPVSLNYNGSVYFSEEVINVTFDSSQAHMKALYTFKNNDSESVELDILLPFHEFEGPEELILTKNEKNINFTKVSLNTCLETYDISGDFWAIKVPLEFSGFEEIAILVQYSRDYIIYDFSGNSEIHYNFKYLVGTAKAWNKHLDSAYFEFWIPKGICDDSSTFINRDKTSFILDSLPKHYVISIEYQDWIPDEDYINLFWYKYKDISTTSTTTTNTTTVTPASGFTIVSMLFASLLIGLVTFRKRRR